MSGVDIPSAFEASFDTCRQVTPLCPVELTTYGDYFGLGSGVFFTALFTLSLIAQIGVGAWGRTWSFSIFLGIGTAFEIMGYGARISMSPIGTPWNYPAFIIQLLMLMLGPTMVAAAISVTFKWIVIYLDPKYSVLKSKWYPWVFVGSDFVSILIQAAGGAISSIAAAEEVFDQKLLDLGSGLLVAGTAFQAANMTFCGGLMVIYWRRYRAGQKRGDVMRGERAKRASAGMGGKDVSGKGFWPQTRFQKYLYAIIVAYVAILIRCIYRIPEMAYGWGSKIMQNETLFLIFDGAMIATAVLLLTIVHPAIFFPILRSQSKGGRAAPIEMEDTVLAQSYSSLTSAEAGHGSEPMTRLVGRQTQ